LFFSLLIKYFVAFFPVQNEGILSSVLLREGLSPKLLDESKLITQSLELFTKHSRQVMTRMLYVQVLRHDDVMGRRASPSDRCTPRYPYFFTPAHVTMPRATVYSMPRATVYSMPHYASPRAGLRSRSTICFVKRARATPSWLWSSAARWTSPSRPMRSSAMSRFVLLMAIVGRLDAAVRLLDNGVRAGQAVLVNFHRPLCSLREITNPNRQIAERRR
jgi:hypothetical protein